MIQKSDVVRPGMDSYPVNVSLSLCDESDYHIWNNHLKSCTLRLSRIFYRKNVIQYSLTFFMKKLRSGLSIESFLVKMIYFLFCGFVRAELIKLAKMAGVIHKADYA